MNAYKKNLSRVLPEGASNDEISQLEVWYSQVVHGSDLRDRVTVTGSNISRGVFGSLSLYMQPEADSNPEAANDQTYPLAQGSCT